MKIALLQLNYIVGDVRGNAEKIISAVHSLKNDSIDLCITSELALLGYPPKDLLFNPDVLTQSDLMTAYIAKELAEGPALLLGRVVCNNGKGRRFYNAVSFIHHGKIQKDIYKTLLPTYDVFDEERYFEPGSDVAYFEFKGKKLGITICEDIWNADFLTQSIQYHVNPVCQLAEQKIDYLINVSASPFSLNKHREQRGPLISGIAKRLRIPMVYVNQVGGNDELIFDGQSCVFSANGDLIAQGKAFQEDVLIVDLHSGIGKIELNETSEEEQIFNALVCGTKDYIKKCGFQKVVLGLSGGIDSALTLVVAVHALGKENVHAVLLPSPYSSQSSIDDALKLAENLGVKTTTIPIDNIMRAFDQSLASAFQGYAADVTEENIQARIRGNLLMAMSNKFQALLLTTGNKSELAVGYCTIYGDMSGGLAVISDVFKTMVFRVSRWINQTHQNVIPEEILHKAPSAELRPNQTDQDSLPPYDVLDDILLRLIERHQSFNHLIQAGYDPILIDNIMQLIAKSEFKRKQAAPGLKVTEQAFGSGWKMPVAAKKIMHLVSDEQRDAVKCRVKSV